MRELSSKCKNRREKSSFYFSCPKIARRDKTVGEHPAVVIRNAAAGINQDLTM